MPKIISGILIIVASFLLGSSLSYAYRKRIKFLNDFLEFIAFSEGEAQIYKREMKVIIKKFAEGCSGEFAQFLENRFLEKDNTETDTEDKRQVEEFVAGMEELDSASQKNFIELCKTRAEKSLVEAEANEKSKGAVLKKLLPLGGAALFLIIV